MYGPFLADDGTHRSQGDEEVSLLLDYDSWLKQDLV